MKRLPVLMLCLAVAAGCAQDHRSKALAGTADVIVAGYRDLAGAAGSLRTKSEAFCNAPDADGLQAAREAWNAAMCAWMRIQAVRFGAIREQSRDYKLQFWPDPRDLAASDTEALIAGDEPITPERIAAGGVAVQGLPAIEYLLYPDEGEALGRFRAEPRRCAALTAIAGNVVATADSLVDDWSANGGDYAARLTEYGEGARFADADEALSLVVGSLAESVQDIASSKLGRPLGTRGDGTPQPLRVESRRSRRSLANVRANLAGVETLLTAGETFGIADLLRTRDGGAELADAIDAKLEAARSQAARSQAAALERPLYDALADGTDLAGYRELLATTRELDRLISEDLPGALGVKLGFNFNDGD